MRAVASTARITTSADRGSAQAIRKRRSRSEPVSQWLDVAGVVAAGRTSHIVRRYCHYQSHTKGLQWSIPSATRPLRSDPPTPAGNARSGRPRRPSKSPTSRGQIRVTVPARARASSTTSSFWPSSSASRTAMCALWLRSSRTASARTAASSSSSPRCPTRTATSISRSTAAAPCSCGAVSRKPSAIPGNSPSRSPRRNWATIAMATSLPQIVEPEIAEPTTWTVEYHVPLALFTSYFGCQPPSSGTAWRANFYKCGDKTSHPHWGSWAPVRTENPGFHQPAFFQPILFD